MVRYQPHYPRTTYNFSEDDMTDSEKVFHIKRYSSFPFKKDNDEIVKTSNSLEEAQFEQAWFSNKEKLGRKYYVMDYPHENVVASSKLEREWRKALNFRGLFPD